MQHPGRQTGPARLLAAHIQLREEIEERLPTLPLIGAGRPATAYAGRLTQVAMCKAMTTMGVCDPPEQAPLQRLRTELTPHQSDGLVWRVVGNVIIRVIADRMGITPQTVTQHWDAAGRKIRKIEWEGR